MKIFLKQNPLLKHKACLLIYPGKRKKDQLHKSYGVYDRPHETQSYHKHFLTFYLFHKLGAGDLVSVVWHEEDFLYRVKETKIVEDTDLSILEQGEESILTMFTCHPIYSTEKRLVIVSELIENEM